MRWFDGLAVMVTFRQTDPFYAVDLTDPDGPGAAGRAEDPGLLLVPAPDRRRPDDRDGLGRRPGHGAVPRRARRRSSTSAT